MATAVQRIGKGAALPASLTIGAGDGWVTPSAGDLIVVFGNSDNTASMTSSGYTAGPSVIDQNAAYSWYKRAAGTESSITITPSGAANTNMVACSYSGGWAVGAFFDTSNSSTIAASDGVTTTATPVTTTQAGDLIVVGALLGQANNDIPINPVWTNSFVQVAQASSGSGDDTHNFSFVAELLPAGAAGVYTTSCSWEATELAGARQQIILAFKETASTFLPAPPRVVGQAVNRSNTY